MDEGMRGKFGVKGGSEDVTVLDEDGLALVFGEDGDSLSDFFDDGAANENHFERLFGERASAEEDVAGELAAVAVAENGHIEELERILRRIFDVRGKKNRTGTGAENGVALGGELANGFVEAFFPEELELGGGFAAGENEAIAGLDIGDGANFNGRRSEFAEAGGVRGEVTLDGEDTDFHGVVQVEMTLVDNIFG